MQLPNPTNLLLLSLVTEASGLFALENHWPNPPGGPHGRALGPQLGRETLWLMLS